MGIFRSYHEVYAPRFFIEADGELAHDLIPYVSKFEYEDDEAKIDKLTLTVANPGLRFKDDPRWKEGCRFRVRFGYLSDISDVKNVVIAHARPHFGKDQTIVMVAFNLQQDMNKKANPVNWGVLSSSDVARRIAERYRFKLEVEESNDARRQARVQPAGVTDIQYLMNLAKQINWDCFIEGETLHFHKKKYDTPAVLEYVYYTDTTGSLLEFEPDVNMTAPPGVAKAGTDNKDAHTESAAAGRPPSRYRALDNNNAQVGQLIPGRIGPRNYAGEGGLVGPSHETDPRVIARHGEAAGQRVDMDAIKATAKMIGTPRLRARTMIRISGVDQQYSGNWRVAKSKHVIDKSGYKADCNLKRDAGKAKAPDNNKHDDGTGGGGKVRRTLVDNNQARISGVFSR